MLSTLKIIVDSPFLHTCRQMTYETQGGYILGVKDVDIFKPQVVEGPRIRRPNCLYSETLQLFTYTMYSISLCCNKVSILHISEAIQSKFWKLFFSV